MEYNNEENFTFDRSHLLILRDGKTYNAQGAVVE